MYLSLRYLSELPAGRSFSRGARRRPRPESPDDGKFGASRKHGALREFELKGLSAVSTADTL
jgi:hypothetical protein